MNIITPHSFLALEAAAHLDTRLLQALALATAIQHLKRVCLRALLHWLS